MEDWKGYYEALLFKQRKGKRMMFLLLSRLVGRTQREYPLVCILAHWSRILSIENQFTLVGVSFIEPKQGMPLVCAAWLVRRKLLGNAPLAMRVPLPWRPFFLVSFVSHKKAHAPGSW